MRQVAQWVALRELANPYRAVRRNATALPAMNGVLLSAYRLACTPEYG